MSWRSAFLLQARSDFYARGVLNRQRVEYCHQLHYLQMASEKLAKGFLTAESSSQPPLLTHAAFVRCLQVMKGRPDVRRLLNFSSGRAFVEYVESLLPLAEQVQRLAPSYAGLRGPNPEYPWQSTAQGSVVAPAEFDFRQFEARSPQMNKLLRLMSDLLRVVS
ncbi:MAG TPA: hypothetical protein VH253_18055 [Phycisphaerae bacterium]|nr:hypothetical protein [Phycisphaerae bacterium]